MKLHSFFYGLIATVIVLFSISVGGFYWLASHSPLSLLRAGGEASPAAAMFVPKQAPLMASLLVNPDRLESFRLAAARPGERRRARVELHQFKQSLLAQTGLSYEQDVQPWIGNEITLAVTTPDIDRDQVTGQQPGYLLVATAKDPAQARAFLQLFWQKRAIAGTDLVFEQYAGVKLIYGSEGMEEHAPQAETDSKTQSSNSQISNSQSLIPPLSSAMVGDRFVLFANHPKVLRDAINNVQAPSLSISSSDSYQQALQDLPFHPIGVTFINLPSLETWLGKSSSDSITASETNPPQLYASLIAGLELNPQGLVAETTLFTAPEQKLPLLKPALSKPVQALQFIPAVSPLSAAGENLQQLWTQVSGELSNYKPLFNLVNQTLVDLQSRWGVEPSKDLLGWVQGEYALGLLPRSNQAQPDWIFVAERSPETEAAIAHLDAIAKQQGLGNSPLNLENQQVFAWTRLSAANPNGKQKQLTLQTEVQGVHATVGTYEILATSVEAMDKALKAPQDSLRETQEFQQAIAPLSKNNSGYLYVDWAAVRGLVNQQIPLVSLVELAGKPFFDHLRSLTISSYGSDAKARRGGIFIQLKDI